MKNILYITMVIVLTSCFKDIGNYDYSNIDEIIIDGIPESFGDLILFEDTIVINPTVYLGDNIADDNKFNYYWSEKKGKGTSAKMVRFSEEKKLVFPVNNSGGISLMFEAENKETGIIRFKSTVANGTSQMSNGFYLLKENSNGTTDVDMISFDSETGEPLTFANLLETTFGYSLEGAPVALDYWGYRQENFETASLITVPAIKIASNKDIVVINTDKFEIVSTFDDLFLGDIPPANRNIQALKSIQKNTILINDGKVYCFTNYYSQIINSEYKEFGGNKFYPELLGNYNMSKNISWPINDSGLSFLTFDNNSGMFKYVITSLSEPKNIREQSEITNFADPLNADLLLLESTATGAYKFNLYALFKDKQYPDSLILIDMDVKDLNQGILKQNRRTKLKASNYLIDDASNYCVHQHLQTIYFSIGDKLYKHNPANNSEELIKTFDGNEITHIDIVNEWYTIPGSYLYEMTYTKLIVATQSGDDYTFMKFDMNNETPSSEPIFTRKGKGKVTDYMYIKPSVMPSWVRIYN